MNHKHTVGLLLFGFAVAVLCFILLVCLHPKADSLEGSFGDCCQRIRWRCLYGKPYKRSTSCCNICLENLTRIDHATQEWALEEEKGQGDVPARENLKTYLWNWPECPKGGEYIIGSVNRSPSCSICGESPSTEDNPPILVRNVVLLWIEALLVTALICFRFVRIRRKRMAISILGNA